MIIKTRSPFSLISDIILAPNLSTYPSKFINFIKSLCGGFGSTVLQFPSESSCVPQPLNIGNTRSLSGKPTGAFNVEGFG